VGFREALSREVPASIRQSPLGCSETAARMELDGCHRIILLPGARLDFQNVLLRLPALV
jgi:hypothetical protein